MKNKNLVTILLICFSHFFCFSNQVHEQQEIKKKNKFTSLKKALKTPEKVYELDLDSKGLTELPYKTKKFTKNEAPRGKLTRYHFGKSLFYSHQGVGNKTHKIPRLSPGISSAK